jgi:hypothetical protein
MKDMTNAANTMLSNKEKADLEAIGANPFSASMSTSTAKPPHLNGGFTQPAGDHPQPGQEWEYICRMLGHTDGAVKVVTHIACEANVTETWVNGCVEWVTKLLMKSGRMGKVEVFECLTLLLLRSVLSTGIALVVIGHSSLLTDMTTVCRSICYAL